MLSLCCPSLPWDARQFICLHTSDAKHWWEKWGSILICIRVYLYALLFLLVLLLPLAIFTFVISSSQLYSPQSLFILSLWFLSLLLLSNLSFLYFFLQIRLQHHYVTKLFALKISCSSPCSVLQGDWLSSRYVSCIPARVHLWVALMRDWKTKDSGSFLVTDCLFSYLLLLQERLQRFTLLLCDIWASDNLILPLSFCLGVECLLTSLVFVWSHCWFDCFHFSVISITNSLQKTASVVNTEGGFCSWLDPKKHKIILFIISLGILLFRLSTGPPAFILILALPLAKQVFLLLHTQLP